MSKTVAVFGATGDQGSSVVKSLLEAGWTVTAFTRDTNGAKAQALGEQGVKLAQADLDDPESYKDALKGQDAVFVNADFWAIYLKNGYDSKGAKAGEIKQAKAAIQAAVDAGIKHIVYSTLDGGLGCDHWDSKSEVSTWIKEQGFPVTNLYLTFYFSGIVKYNLVSKNDDGSFTLGIPMPDTAKVPGLPVEQTGEWVKVALEDPKKWIGKDMYAITGNTTVAEMAATLAKISGKDVKTNNLPEQVFLSDEFKQKVGEEMWDNWKLFYDGNLQRDVPASMALIPQAWDFEDWAKQNSELKKILGF